MKHCLLALLIFSQFLVYSQDYKADSAQNIFGYELVYSALPWYNLSGGNASGFVYIDNVDVVGNLHVGQIFGSQQDLSIFLYGLGNHGGSATALMGDYQVASNIETVPSWRLYEAWAQYNFNQDRLSLLAGLYDLNSEFDILEPGLLFVHSSFGIGAEYAQTGENGPSIFAVTSLAFRAAGVIGDRTQWRVGIFDGVPGDPNDLKRNNINLSKSDGALLATEVSVFLKSLTSALSAANQGPVHLRHKKVGREHDPHKKDKLNIGAWYYTASFEEIGDPNNTSTGNFGAYLGYQKYMNHWSLFARYGLANERFNRFGSAISGGFVKDGLFNAWDDQIGLAFSSGVSGRSYHEAFDTSDRVETAIELTYVVAPASWLNVKPNIQYVINPDTQAGVKNAFAVALMVQVAL